MKKKVFSIVAIATTGCSAPNKGESKNDKMSISQFLRQKGFKENEIDTMCECLRKNGIETEKLAPKTSLG